MSTILVALTVALAVTVGIGVTFVLLGSTGAIAATAVAAMPTAYYFYKIRG